MAGPTGHLHRQLACVPVLQLACHVVGEGGGGAEVVPEAVELGVHVGRCRCCGQGERAEGDEASEADRETGREAVREAGGKDACSKAMAQMRKAQKACKP